MAALTIEEIPRFWRTISHLQPSQLGWRLKYLVERRLETQAWYRYPVGMLARRDLPRLELSRPHFRTRRNLVPPPIDRLSELSVHRLTLLNEQRKFAGGNDWRLLGEGSRHRLWDFSLHYHAWLKDLALSYACTRRSAYLTELRRWLIDWLTHCGCDAPGFSRFAWNSFNIGERLAQWREIDQLIPDSFWQDSQLPRSRFLQSISQQADYLSRHIEWDLRGNHLFKDAVGLAAAADLLKGAAPPQWAALAANITAGQIQEQLLPDGVHFERSPMYHLHVMQDLLTLSETIPDVRTLELIRDACQRMAEPLRWLKHPCGRFPLFNDSADCGLRPARLESQLIQAGILSDAPSPAGFRYFDCAGILAWQGKPWTVFWDVGDVGPTYQPGHAHADTLTVEMSFGGVPLVVDPGVVCYDQDDRRRYDRSTAAHNTVVIDDTDSSEVWHIFRVGRRAQPKDVSFTHLDTGFIGHASHTGYDHLPGAPCHSRRLRCEHDQLLEICDEVTGLGWHRVAGGFLLAPEWKAESVPGGWIL
ncbi:MAG: alginate lyase family protein, partial [Planctomycetaceae bacterium]